MVTVAKTAGFCFGVQRAVDMAEKACQEYGCIWALGDIIHNTHEVGRLEKLGVHKAEDVADIPDGVPVLIRAHGVPGARRAAAGTERLPHCRCHVSVRRKDSPDCARGERAGTPNHRHRLP